MLVSVVGGFLLLLLLHGVCCGGGGCGVVVGWRGGEGWGQQEGGEL